MTLKRYCFDTVFIGYPIDTDTDRHRPETQTQTRETEQRDREAEPLSFISFSASSAREGCPA